MQTIFFKNKPRITSSATIIGPKESASFISNYVDEKISDDLYGEKTFELAERKMLTYAINKTIQKSCFLEKQIGVIISGDLLNQIISASFSAREFNIPFLGVYGACSTMAESMILGATLIDGGYVNNAICATSSHFSTAERQYRYPLELGSTRPPQAQWTVTGAGANLICSASEKNDNIAITSATIGKVTDYGVTDVNNMGAAMAPSCFSTLNAYFKDTNSTVDNLDLIVTGDLGALGSTILCDLAFHEGYDIENKHVDCGKIIYNDAKQQFQGGSGAGCSAVVFNSYVLNKIKNGELNKVLFIATGALLSTISSAQGESIPCISHAVLIERV